MTSRHIEIRCPWCCKRAYGVLCDCYLDDKRRRTPEVILEEGCLFVADERRV